MTGDAFLTEPAGGVGRAMQAGAQIPLLDQEFDSGTLYALRAAVQAHASRAGLSEDRVGEVVLAVHELAANAIAHGAGHGRLRMWDLADALSCEIVDGGPAGAGSFPGPAGAGSAPSPAGAGSASSPAGAGAASSPAGPGAASSPAEAGGPPAVVDPWPAVMDPWPAVDGHGLWLVRQVADQMDLRSGLRGTRAIVTFALPLPEDH